MVMVDVEDEVESSERSEAATKVRQKQKQKKDQKETGTSVPDPHITKLDRNSKRRNKKKGKRDTTQSLVGVGRWWHVEVGPQFLASCYLLIVPRLLEPMLA
ncbi:hypothetical protein LINPERPRIM_LOCUS38839, partial [Linum perenne]